MSAPAIRLTNLGKRFQGVVAVEGLSLEITAGEVLALVGPSGCGKTTTLRLVAGFETADAGTVHLGGTLLVGPETFVAPEKRRVGMVFQEYALFPHLTVAGNVEYGLRRGRGRRERVGELVSLVGLEGLERRFPHELSGGQQQRVALARALAPRPRALLLDEPFSNLDPDLRERVRAEVKQILRRAEVTAVFVTHDRHEAMNMGDRVAIMRGGRVEQVGSPEEVYHRPASREVAEFLGPAAFLEARVEDGGLLTDVGRIPQCPPVQPLERGEPVQVMVRPDDVSLRLDGAGQGTVVDREVRGGYHRYRVVLPSGTVLESDMPHTRDVPLASCVHVELTPGHPLVCFRDRVGLRQEHDVPCATPTPADS